MWERSSELTSPSRNREGHSVEVLAARTVPPGILCPRPNRSATVAASDGSSPDVAWLTLAPSAVVVSGWGNLPMGKLNPAGGPIRATLKATAGSRKVLTSCFGGVSRDAGRMRSQSGETAFEFRTDAGEAGDQHFHRSSSPRKRSNRATLRARWIPISQLSSVRGTRKFPRDVQ